MTTVRILMLLMLPALLVKCSQSPHDVAARADNAEELAAMLDTHPEALEELNSMGKTPLHYAVTYGRDASIAVLLDRGAAVGAQDHTGMTALHMAASLNRVEEAMLLVQAGAKIDAVDEFGDTPLHTAAIHGQEKMIRYLLTQDADPNAKNLEGKTPLDLARRERKEGAEKALGQTQE